MYRACLNDHDIVVQVLLNHGVQVDIPDEVSDISCIHVKLLDTTEVNETTLVTQEIKQKMISMYVITHQLL